MSNTNKTPSFIAAKEEVLQSIYGYAENLSEVSQADGEEAVALHDLCDNVRDDMVDVVKGTNGVAYFIEDYGLEGSDAEDLPVDQLVAMLLAFNFSN